MNETPIAPTGKTFRTHSPFVDRGVEPVRPHAVPKAPVASVDPYETFSRVRRFGSLDALRALSIFAVMFHHAKFPASVPILDRGSSGVHLFFAISGFLIPTLLLREKRTYGSVSLRDFYIRRSLRIFPLYYAVLLVYIVLVSTVERDTAAGAEFISNLPYFFTYTQNWFVQYDETRRNIFYFSWSLATEEQFYLVFPGLVAFLSTRRVLFALGVTAAVAFLTHFSFLDAWLSHETVGHYMLWSIAPCIVLGALAAVVLDSRTGYRWLYLIFGHRYSLPVTACATLFALSFPETGMGLEYITYILFVGLVIAAVIREDNGLARFLHNPFLIRIGMISYGLYMLHMLCFNAAGALGEKVGLESWVSRLVFGFPLALFAAEMSFRTFERWFLEKKALFVRPVG